MERMVVLVAILVELIVGIELGVVEGESRLSSRFARSLVENDAVQFLGQFNQMAEEVYFKAVKANWNYKTNITEENQQKLVESKLEIAEFLQEARRNASVFERSGFSNDTVRQLKKLLYIGDSALENKQDLEELKNTGARMVTRYSTGEVCASGDDCLSLEPDLTRIMAESRNYAELYWAWNGWRDAVGKDSRDDYKDYVRLKNLAAIANDQPDSGAYWRSRYEVDDLKADVLKLYNELKPFYQQLHAYVRRKLYNVYGSNYINLDGPIPAHLLGNMWAQKWREIFDICEPFPGKLSLDITPALKEKGYDALQMFETAEEFFTSLGLLPMPEAFWNHSMIVKPDDREVVCHASAFDFYNQKDFRIKQCTDITQSDFTTIHHEMGHIQYYLQYKDLPVLYRRGANNGFHEAVGDVLALSVATPKHLHAVGLLDQIEDDPESDINYMMRVALDKIAFLPFGLLMDLWRWGVFDGSIPDTKYNEEWWKLRLEYQGVVPPTPRSESDFDPAAKYHIPSDVPYVRYFIARIFQFQFHEALCNASGHTGPLHKCDIYQSQAAGKLLGDMLKMGSSKPWPEALEKITGQRQMSALPLVNYFQPLMEFLEKENGKNNETIGWPDTEWMPQAPPAWKTSDSSTTRAAILTLIHMVFITILLI